MEYTIFLWIIGISVFHFLLERILGMLNDSKKAEGLPPEADGIYDKERYETWLAYDKTKGRFGRIASFFNFFVLLAMLILGGFGWLDDFIRETVTKDDLWLPLLFFGALGAASSLIGLPFAWYGTFVIEERFGFNKTTPKVFVFDRIKGALLSVALGGSIGGFVIFIYHLNPDSFWIVAWLFLSGITLLMNMFYTSTFARIFNKITPLEDGPLREAIEVYSQSVGYKLKNIFIMDGSKRSTKANAYFSGLGPKKSIVLYDTLIEKFETEEIVAVLAHEVGHYRKKHIPVSTTLALLQMGLTFFLLSLTLSIPYFSLALGDQPSFHLGLLVFGLLYSPVSLILGLGMNILSRKNEFEADAFAKETSSGAALVSSLKRLASENLVNLNPHPLHTFFHASHPPVLERVKALEKS